MIINNKLFYFWGRSKEFSQEDKKISYKVEENIYKPVGRMHEKRQR